MATEREYDEIIAPMLLDVVKRCEELGMSLIARVEWEPGESGITQFNPTSSIGQTLTFYAAHSHGNVDKFCLSLIKHADVSQSAFLSPHAERFSQGG